VELRGLEPLTPSLRTRGIAAGQASLSTDLGAQRHESPGNDSGVAVPNCCTSALATAGAATEHLRACAADGTRPPKTARPTTHREGSGTVGGRQKTTGFAGAREYFDKYLFEADPVLLRRIVNRMVALVPPGTDMLGGLELGRVPLATILSNLSVIPTV